MKRIHYSLSQIETEQFNVEYINPSISLSKNGGTYYYSDEEPLDIKVTSILPGDTKTGFTASREKSVDNGRYGDHISKSVSKMEKDESSGVPAYKVAKKIYKVSKKKNPNTYYVVGLSYRFLVFISRILPKRLVNWIIFKIYG